MAYTDQASVEAYLGRSLTSSETTYLTTLIATAKATIDDIAGGEFEQTASSSNFYNGGVRDLQIDPATTISSVELVDTLGNVQYTYEDNSSVSEYQIEPDSDGVKRWIRKRVGRFPRGINNIKVTGVFGLATDVPSEVQHATNLFIGSALSSNSVEGLKRESIEGYSREWITQEENMAKIKGLLATYLDDDIYI